MATYESYLNEYKNNFNDFKYDNPYSFSYGRPSEEAVSNMSEHLVQREPLQIENKRSILDRTLDAFMAPIYMSAGFADGLFNMGENKTAPIQGVLQGYEAGNPFGEGNTQGEKTYSDVLGSAGWNPTSGVGKFARGAVGFGLDVALDPLTYLSGGTSALVKGTGRTAKIADDLARTADDVGRFAEERIATELIDKDISPTLAKRFAEKKASEISGQGIKGLTPDMAEEIVRYRLTKGGEVRTADNIRKSATKLADEYNRLLGIRDLNGGGQVTYGLGNIPFAPKSWDRFNISLGSDMGLRRVGDALGFSKAYSELRSAVYGSQIGKLFSTTSPIYKLAKKDPQRLWETMEYTEHVRGLKLDKLQKEKLIRDRFKSLHGLTEAENKEVLDLLENKTIMHKVREKVKFTDLEKTKEIRNIIKARNAEDEKRLDDLFEKRDNLDSLKESIDDGIIQERQVYDALRKEYQEEIANLGSIRTNDREKIEELIESYQKQIDEINNAPARSVRDTSDLEELHSRVIDKREARKAHFEGRNNLVNNKNATQGEMRTPRPQRRTFYDSAKHKELQSQLNKVRTQISREKKRAEKSAEKLPELELRRSELEGNLELAIENGRATKRITNNLEKVKRQISELNPEPNFHRETTDPDTGVKSLSNLYDEAHQLEEQIRANTKRGGGDVVEQSDVYDDLAKGANETIDREARSSLETTPDLSEKYELVDKLNDYIFGNGNRYLGYRMRDEQLDELMKRVKEGQAPKEIREYIEENARSFSPFMQEVYSFVSKQLGYNRWDKDGYKYPLANLLKMKSQKEVDALSVRELEQKVFKEAREGNLSDTEFNAFNYLTQLKAKRHIMISEFGSMGEQRFRRWLSDMEDKNLLSYHSDTQDSILNRSRGDFSADDANTNQGVETSAFDSYEYFVKEVDEETGTVHLSVQNKPFVRNGDRFELPLTQNAFISNSDRSNIYWDLIEEGVFTRKALERVTQGGSNTSFSKYVNAIITEYERLLREKFQLNYKDMSPGQKRFALSLAVEGAKKGKMIDNEIISKSAYNQMQLRKRQEAIEAVENEVRMGHEVVFMKDNKPYKGIVDDVARNEDNMTAYTVRIPTSDEVHKGVLANQVVRVKSNNRSLSSDELHERSVMNQTDIEEKSRLISEMDSLKSQLSDIDNTISRKKETINDLQTKLRNQDKHIRQLEKSKKERDQSIRDLEANDIETKISQLESQIRRQEELLNNNDALETWMRTHGEVDVALFEDPQRHTRYVREFDSARQAGKPDKWKASAGATADGEPVIKILRGDFEYDDVRNALRMFSKELKEKGWTSERVSRLREDMINTPTKVRQFIIEHELSHVNHKDFYGTHPRRNYNDPRTRAVESRAVDEGLQMVENFDVDNMLNDASMETGRIMLSDMASSKKVEEVVRTLRAVFDEIAEEEIDIGKLSKEQFDGMMNRYFPHVPTEAGEEWIRRNKDDVMPGQSITYDLGYGVKFNPFGQERRIRGTVSEINKSFEDKLKGKNLFNESVAEAYLVRATTHNDLMYDNNYMQNMMNVFGKEVGEDGIVEEGYEAVMNHGMLRTTVHDMASMELSSHITDSVSDFIRTNIDDLKNQARQSNRNLDDVIEEGIQGFIRDEFPEERVKNIYESMLQGTIRSTELPDMVLGADAVPMMQMNTNQIKNIRRRYDEVYRGLEERINHSLNTTLVREGTDVEEAQPLVSRLREIQLFRERPNLASQSGFRRASSGEEEEIANKLRQILSSNDNLSQRMQDIMNRFEKLDGRTPPQIKQVNDVIVQRANQARMIQQAKDESDMLKLYDQFTHYMKLSQTVVMPAFHLRNKYSNMFNNWLGTGRDSINAEYQMATGYLAHFKGDLDAIKEKMSVDKFNKRFRPITVSNPHPSLVEAVNLNNGQLHWNDLYDLAKQYDVIDEGYFAQEIAGAGRKGQGVASKFFGASNNVRRFDPTDSDKFIGFETGTKVGTVVENGDRLIHFIAQLKQGKSVEEAMQSSKKYLFDYSDLTAFEQQKMKRIFPYYTWLRKNARLQVSQVIENPEKYRLIAKIKAGMEGANDEEDMTNDAFLSDFVRDWWQTPLYITNERGNREPIMFNPNLPFMDLGRIPDPSQPWNSFKELFTQTVPQIKVPIELGLNKNVFFDSQIAQDDENRVVESAKHMASQFAGVNAIDGLGRGGVDTGLHVFNNLTGVKGLSYDYETQRNMKIQDIISDMREGRPLGEEIDSRITNAFNNAGGNLVRGTANILGQAGASVGKNMLNAFDTMIGQPPKNPEDYSGALRPLSVESYNALSDSEKEKYTPPTADVAMAYNRQAEELSNQEYEETGRVKRFVWSLLDNIDSKIDYDNDDNTNTQVGYVTSVTDGDTFKVRIGDSEESVRMLLVDTPETVDPDMPVMPYGEEARNRTRGLLENDVKLHIAGTDDYGRTLAYVELPDGTDYNKELISEGLGRVRYTRDNFPSSSTYGRTDNYFYEQRRASENQRGIWSLDGYGGNPNEDSGYNLFSDAVRRWLEQNN